MDVFDLSVFVIIFFKFIPSSLYSCSYHKAQYHLEIYENYVVAYFCLLHAMRNVTRGIRLYNGHLRGPSTLSPFAECLAVGLSLPVFTIRVCRSWDSNTQPSACKTNSLTDCAIAATCCMSI